MSQSIFDEQEPQFYDARGNPRKTGRRVLNPGDRVGRRITEEIGFRVWQIVEAHPSANYMALHRAYAAYFKTVAPSDMTIARIIKDRRYKPAFDVAKNLNMLAPLPDVDVSEALDPPRLRQPKSPAKRNSDDSMTDHDFCETCRFWWSTPGEDVGECHYNAPFPFVDPNLGGRRHVPSWPEMQRDEGCGQHQPRRRSKASV